MKLMRLPLFWIATLVFVGGLVVYAWLVWPPLVRQQLSHSSALNEQEQLLAATKQYNEVVKSVKADESVLDTLYSAANRALPIEVQSDLLLLELDALLSANDMSNLTITVPYGTAATSPSATTSAAAPSDDGVIKPGGAGTTSTEAAAPASSTPVVKSGNNTTFSLAGEVSYSQLQTLITKVQQLSRWCKITALDVTAAGGKTTVTISAQAFTRAKSTAEFTGRDPKFLEKAKELFLSVPTYTTVPDPQTEGEFGKSNPFN